MTKAELQAKASTLGVQFDDKTTVEQLSVLIENAELKDTLKGVNKQLAAKEKQLNSDSQLPVVTVDKVDYQVTVARFMHNRTIYTAEQLAENEELQAELIKKGSEVLTSQKVLKQRAADRATKVKSTQAFMNQVKIEAVTPGA